MDDLFQKLNDILSSEEGQKQLSALTAALGEGGNTKSDASDTGNTPDLSGLLAGLSNTPPAQNAGGLALPDGINMDMMLKLSRVMQKLHASGEDNNTRLLQALKPHLKSEHQHRADEAAQMLRLLELLPALREGGLF